jgi:hypothetical protein
LRPAQKLRQIPDCLGPGHLLFREEGAFSRLGGREIYEFPGIHPKTVHSSGLNAFNNSQSLEILEGKIRKYLNVIAEHCNVALQWDDATSVFSKFTEGCQHGHLQKYSLTD